MSLIRFSIALRRLSTLCALLVSSLLVAAQNAAPDPTQHNLQLMLSGKGSQLVQKPIVLLRVAVQGKPPGKNTNPKDLGETHNPAFWVGPSPTHRVLVIIPNGLVPVNMSNNTAAVSPGDLVNITGTVRKAPDATQLKAVYHLSKDEIDVVHREGVIVQASAIDVRGPAPRH